MPGFVSTVKPRKRTNALPSKRIARLAGATAVIGLLVLADQITKRWAVGALTEGLPAEILGSFLQFTLVYNEGGAMGTMLGSPLVYLVVALLLIPLLGWYLFRTSDHTPLFWSLSTILGGALGNLADRIRLGKVIDFIDIDLPDTGLLPDRWWTFNVADAAITCGLVALIVIHLRSGKTGETQSNSLDSEAGQTVEDK